MFSTCAFEIDQGKNNPFFLFHSAKVQATLNCRNFREVACNFVIPSTEFLRRNTLATNFVKNYVLKLCSLHPLLINSRIMEYKWFTDNHIKCRRRLLDFSFISSLPREEKDDDPNSILEMCVSLSLSRARHSTLLFLFYKPNTRTRDHLSS